MPILNPTFYKLLNLTALALSISVASVVASAQNIQMNDMSLKSELDWLQAQGVIQISTTTWPLTTNEINRSNTYSANGTYTSTYASGDLFNSFF